MRYRGLTATGDYQFGNGPNQFLINTPEAVAQAIGTRLALLKGEWFIDLDEGLDMSRILGENTRDTYDQEIQERILGTDGVLAIDQYYSALDTGRNLTVACAVSTIYGDTSVKVIL